MRQQILNTSMNSPRWTVLAALFLYLAALFGAGLAHGIELSQRCGCELALGEEISLSAPLPQEHDFHAHQHDCGLCRIATQGKIAFWPVVAPSIREAESRRFAYFPPFFSSQTSLEIPSLRGPPAASA